MQKLKCIISTNRGNSQQRPTAGYKQTSKLLYSKPTDYKLLPEFVGNEPRLYHYVITTLIVMRRQRSSGSGHNIDERISHKHVAYCVVCTYITFCTCSSITLSITGV